MRSPWRPLKSFHSQNGCFMSKCSADCGPVRSNAEGLADGHRGSEHLFTFPPLFGQDARKITVSIHKNDIALPTPGYSWKKIEHEVMLVRETTV